MMYSNFNPPYLSLSEEVWRERFLKAREIVSACRMCPHGCGVNRLKGEVGFCQKAILLDSSQENKNEGSLFFPVRGLKIALSAAVVHGGEEPVLGGKNGVGNLFFSYCNSRCCFCQNAEISQPEKAIDFSCYKSSVELAEILLMLQNKGVGHIGLVSPSHIVLFLLEAIYLAAQKGFNLPIVYNSNGYDSIETLQLLEGIISIYLPDFKYGSNEKAVQFSGLKNYCEIAKKTLREMIRQCGYSLVLEDGLAIRGVIVRHLVLPNNQAESEKVFSQLGDWFSPSLNLSLMAQYYPTYEAKKNPLLNRTITMEEYMETKEKMEANGFFCGWIQELESERLFRPEFGDKENPFKAT